MGGESGTQRAGSGVEAAREGLARKGCAGRADMVAVCVLGAWRGAPSAWAWAGQAGEFWSWAGFLGRRGQGWGRLG